MTKTITLKKYSFFKAISLSDFKELKSGVTFEIQDRPNRVHIWAEKVFNLDPSYFEISSNTVKMAFMDIKDGS